MIAAVFPGQGSQAPGMGKSYFDQFKIAQDTFKEASENLSIDLAQLCFEGPPSELALTQNTQPALLCVSTAIYRVLNTEFGFKPQIAAGHSIGEYAAMVATGALDFKTAIKAVRLRGHAMQEAVPIGNGGMVAVIGLEDHQVKHICEWAEKESGCAPLVPANYNCPGQVVISGNKKTIDYLISNFDASKFAGFPTRVKLMPLNVSAPFHCSLMRPAEVRMMTFFSTVNFQRPAFPIVQNVSAQAETNPEVLKNQLVSQVSAPVRWTESVKTVTALGVNTIVEIGHGKVLAGLIKKISPDQLVLTTQDATDLENLRSGLKALGH